MKRAAVALRWLTARLSAAVGLEGGFLLAGTVLLARGAAEFSPAGPWIVAGAICVVVALALSVPPRRA